MTQENSLDSVASLQDLSFHQARRQSAFDISTAAHLLEKMFHEGLAAEFGRLRGNGKLFRSKIAYWERQGSESYIFPVIDAVEIMVTIKANAKRKYYKSYGSYDNWITDEDKNLSSIFISYFPGMIIAHKETNHAKERVMPLELKKTFYRAARVIDTLADYHSFMRIMSKSIEGKKPNDVGGQFLRKDGFVKINEYIDSYYKLSMENENFKTMPIDWRLDMTDDYFETLNTSNDADTEEDRI